MSRSALVFGQREIFPSVKNWSTLAMHLQVWQFFKMAAAIELNACPRGIAAFDVPDPEIRKALRPC